MDSSQQVWVSSWLELSQDSIEHVRETHTLHCHTCCPLPDPYFTSWEWSLSLDSTLAIFTTDPHVTYWNSAQNIMYTWSSKTLLSAHFLKFTHIRITTCYTNLPDGVAPRSRTATARINKRVCLCDIIDMKYNVVGATVSIPFGEPSASSRERSPCERHVTEVKEGLNAPARRCYLAPHGAELIGMVT